MQAITTPSSPRISPTRPASAPGAAPSAPPAPPASDAATERTAATPATQRASRARVQAQEAQGWMQRAQSTVAGAAGALRGLDDAKGALAALPAAAQAAATGAQMGARMLGERAVDKGVDALSKDWSPKEQAALKDTLRTFEQLAGGDGKFNHGDIPAVVDAVKNDTEGLKKKAHEEVDRRYKGKRLGARMANRAGHSIVDSAFEDSDHFKATGEKDSTQQTREGRRADIRSQAAEQTTEKLTETLDAAHVDPATADQVDRQVRHLDIAQLDRLQSNLKVLESRFAGESGATLPARIQEPLEALAKSAFAGAPPFSEPLFAEGIPNPRRIDAVVDTLNPFR